MPADSVLLVSIDGLRADAPAATDTPVLDALAARGTATYAARTVMPSVTLPCHMSMFHSVEPGRHGITTNTWTPQVRPVPGLLDVLHAAGRSTCAFWNWEQLRDLGRPGALDLSYYHRDCYAPAGDTVLAARCAAHLAAEPVDFCFLYLGYVDACGHDHGWMSPEYLAAATNADAAVGLVLEALESAGRLAGTAVIVTADHGGHERTHGTELPEDMLVPLIAAGPGIAAGSNGLGEVSILDVAPSVAALLHVATPREWMGRALFGEPA